MSRKNTSPATGRTYVSATSSTGLFAAAKERAEGENAGAQKGERCRFWNNGGRCFDGVSGNNLHVYGVATENPSVEVSVGYRNFSVWVQEYALHEVTNANLDGRVFG